jgi:hypothetical protein
MDAATLAVAVTYGLLVLCTAGVLVALVRGIR